MGRGKIEIKRIENSSNRMVTYSKRRNGIMKKAREITVLCDAHVSLVIIASSGKLHEYCSPSTTLIEILEKYHKQPGSGTKLWEAKHENLSSEVDRIKQENASMQIELRHLKGQDITSLHHEELMALEEALQNGLAGVRRRQMDSLKMTQRNASFLEDENKHLRYILHQQEMGVEVNVRDEMDKFYHQRVRDYSSHMPFAFRVQPIQPNLQDII